MWIDSLSRSGGLKVCDANGQPLVHGYSRENPNDAPMAKILTEDLCRAKKLPSSGCADANHHLLRPLRCPLIQLFLFRFVWLLPPQPTKINGGG